MTAEIRAAHPRVRLVVFGEAALGLYHDATNPVAYQRSVAEPIPGPAIGSVGAIARRSGTAIALGLVESAGDTLYNAIVVVDSAGRLIAKHRKMLLFDLTARMG